MFLLPSCNLATITLRLTWFLKWLLSKKQSTWRFTTVSLRKDARECPSYIYCFWQDWRCRSLLGHYDGPQKGLKQGKNSLHILRFPINEACPELLGTICFNIGQKKKKSSISSSTPVFQGPKIWYSLMIKNNNNKKIYKSKVTLWSLLFINIHMIMIC